MEFVETNPPMKKSCQNKSLIRQGWGLISKRNKRIFRWVSFGYAAYAYDHHKSKIVVFELGSKMER